MGTGSGSMSELQRSSVERAVASMVMRPEREGKSASGPGAIARLRNRHHMIARMVVSGMPHEDICRIMGMRLITLQTLINQTPAFAQLLYEYRDQPLRQVEVEDYLDLKWRNMVAAEIALAERLEAEPDKVSTADLLRISADGADRTGFSKHTVSHIVDHGLKERLEGMRRRTSQGAAAGAADRGEDVRAVSRPASASPLLELKATEVSVQVSPAKPEAPAVSPPHNVVSPVANSNPPMSREEVLARHRAALESRNSHSKTTAPIVGTLKRRV